MADFAYRNFHSTISKKQYSEEVDMNEIVTFLGDMGLLTSESEIGEILKEQELRCFIKVDFNELIQLLIDKLRSVNEKKAIHEMFQLFDKDGNGFITGHELRSVMHSLGENLPDEIIDEMIDEADMNGDNQIDFFEFVKTLSMEDDITLFSNQPYC